MTSFLERICRRVRRTRIAKASEEKATPLQSEPLQSSKAGQDTPATSVATTQHCTASSSLQLVVLARGAFHGDSRSPLQSGRVQAMATAEEGGSDSLLDATSTSGDAVTSSAPLLKVDLPVDNSQASVIGSISTPHEECVPSDTSPSVLLKPVDSKEVCTLSATDSGLYSEEEDSIEEEFLEVFSDGEEEEDEDDDGLVEDGWLIPADEFSLDKVVSASSTETVYR